MAQGGVQMSVTADVRAMTRDLERVQRRIVPSVTAQAINQVAKRKVETPGVARLAQEKGVPKSRVRWHYKSDGSKGGRRLVLDKANRNEPIARITWLPRNRRPEISLSSLRARQTRRGVRAGRHFVPSGFIQTVRGGRQVFKRTGRERYPIEVQKIALQPAADKIFGGLVAASGRAFRAEFTRRLALRLRRR